MMKRQLIFCAAAMTLAAAQAGTVDFDRHFCDSTLRLDYIFGADKVKTTILHDNSSKIVGWAGRRHNLDRLPLSGNGRVTVTDEATGDTIYVTSFSSLFQEWLAAPELTETPTAFENVFLVPLPRKAALINVTLDDNRHRPIAGMTHRYSPDDVLVSTKGTNPLPHHYTHRASDPDRAIDVAILAEGYRKEEMDSFLVHAQTVTDEILSYEPYRSFADNFNFIAVESPSAESGVSIPKLGEWKDTAFHSHFSTFYSDRYLTAPRVKSIHDALAGIPYEHIIILANTDEYGGGGIYNSYLLTAARHSTVKPVSVHEFGHSFGGLADEYFYENDIMDESYPAGIEPWEPNITTLVDFKSKWEHQLVPGTPVPTLPEDAAKYQVGVYEGGGYTARGVYRPADECRMRNNTYPVFCPVCREALERLIRFYID